MMYWTDKLSPHDLASFEEGRKRLAEAMRRDELRKQGISLLPRAYKRPPRQRRRLQGEEA